MDTNTVAALGAQVKSTGSFGMNVLASLVAAMAVPPFMQLWNSFIVPGYLNVVYRGKKIDGMWNSEAHYIEKGKPATDIEKITVKQSGCRISGEMIDVKPDEIVKYAFKGDIINSIITASYWKVGGSGDSHDRGVFSLRVVNDAKLEGMFTFYEGDVILDGTYSWKTT